MIPIPPPGSGRGDGRRCPACAFDLRSGGSRCCWPSCAAAGTSNGSRLPRCPPVLRLPLRRIAAAKAKTAAPIVYLVGGRAPPSGVALRADGLSVVPMVIAAIVICAVGVYARADFQTPPELSEARAPFTFWILLLSIWSALNLIFVGWRSFHALRRAGTLDLCGCAARLPRWPRGRRFRRRFAICFSRSSGSVFYLAGTVLIYGAYGTSGRALAFAALSAPNLWRSIAAALMTAGLLAKTALFPLHLWLPPAHASAPAAASAVLSALVVKGLFLYRRFGSGLMSCRTLPAPPQGSCSAGSGAAAIVFGSVLALRQARLKLLIAYSTLAQIGYLFLMFPLASGSWIWRLTTASPYRAACFRRCRTPRRRLPCSSSAGLYLCSAWARPDCGTFGARREPFPTTVLAFALGGLALMGVPSSGSLSCRRICCFRLQTRRVNGGGQWSSRLAAFSRAHTLCSCSPTRWRSQASR